MALTWFVNPGSVGRPEGGDWRASYAILECANGELKADHRRVEYDLARVVRAVHAAGLPKEFVDVFREARSLDQLAGERRNPGARGKGISSRQLDAVMTLARSCQYEREHTHHVTRLALDLFDGLKSLHRMGPRERFQLQCGALLHDIGWTEGRQGHHRTAMQRILSDPLLPFEQRQREIIALVARYHRKSLPRAEDRYFASLSKTDQHRVEVLAGFLRVADGLDRSHAGVVRRLQCRATSQQVTINCHVNGQAEAEFVTAKRKADLVERVFGRRWVFRSLAGPIEGS